jgi:protein TonB
VPPAILALAAALQTPAAAASAAPAVPARATFRSVMRAQDYPAAAIRDNETVRVDFARTIGTNGRASGCRIAHGSGSHILDETRCRIMYSRARYSPARDAEGNPVEGSDSGHHDWFLGE